MVLQIILKIYLIIFEVNLTLYLFGCKNFIPINQICIILIYIFFNKKYLGKQSLLKKRQIFFSLISTFSSIIELIIDGIICWIFSSLSKISSHSISILIRRWKTVSLDSLKEGCMNQYENCIWSVGSIICPYDKDQLFSFYGFGAKVNGTVNHSFPLNFNENKPTVNGLSEIVETYKKALSSVLFSGPTLFSPIIKKTSATAISSFRSSLTYTILLI